jgi:hypothetical protein
MASMKTTAKTRSNFVLGRSRFERISEVEGIKTSPGSRSMFAEFDRKGLTPEQRRTAIFEKHAKKG